ncbi:MAG: DUF3088 domain-containing protein [Kofleriaceae bacterium]|nr:MAG: DUF3088 domain-containing protein [Kofleriaceae bacterium]MBZ0234530.1 DUF3088 domain-containing protein [Kofleriaceae bacterium]
MRDTLYVLRPGFSDKGAVWFCPYSAQVIGLLTYYPRLRETLDVVELDFMKPRYPVATLLGEDHQSLPVLVLGAGSPSSAKDVHVEEAGGVRYVSKTIEILRYLAATRGLPAPH